MQSIRKNLHTILVIVAAVAFLWGILNIFSVFDVNGKMSYSGNSKTDSGSVSDAADTLDQMGSSGTMLYVGNILFGITCLLAGAIGLLYYLKIAQNNPMYDQYIGSKLKFRPAFMMGILGAAGAVLQVICYLFCSASQYGIKVSISVNWTTWMMLVVFAGIAVFDKFVLEKKELQQ